MLITNQNSANEPFAGDALNPQFFGATTEQGAGAISFLVTPDPIEKLITVLPPPVIRNGVLVEFPPYTDVVELQPPAKLVTIPGSASIVRNTFESVGIINPGGQIRLCVLVRPNVIAAAKHYAPTGLDVHFVGSTGTQTAKIIKVALTHDDFECYYLDQAINVVAPSAVAPMEAPGAYYGRSVVIFGLSGLTKPVAGTTALKYALPNASGSWTATASNKSNQPVQTQPGDSGAPVFLANTGKYLGSLFSNNLTEIKVNMASPFVNEIAAL